MKADKPHPYGAETKKHHPRCATNAAFQPANGFPCNCGGKGNAPPPERCYTTDGMLTDATKPTPPDGWKPCGCRKVDDCGHAPPPERTLTDAPDLDMVIADARKDWRQLTGPDFTGSAIPTLCDRAAALRALAARYERMFHEAIEQRDGAREQRDACESVAAALRAEVERLRLGNVDRARMPIETRRIIDIANEQRARADAAEAERDRLAAALRMALNVAGMKRAMREHFVCPECGTHVAADEDGCCASCGNDCTLYPCDCIAIAREALARIEEGK